MTALDLIRNKLQPIRRDSDPTLAGLLALIQKQYGSSLAAVLIYGSYTRGKRDTLLDFYLLLDDYSKLPHWWHSPLCRVLPPNVYHIHIGTGTKAVYAKCAALTLDRFEQAMANDFHSYFWARFAQPCTLLYGRDQDIHSRLAAACQVAAQTFIARSLPLMPAIFSAAELWREGLRRTYQCELRSENPDHIEGLLGASGDYFQQLTTALAGDRLAYQTTSRAGSYCHQPGSAAVGLARFGWGIRRMQGKLLSVGRLLKAAVTFDDGLAYLLWKIERHSGIRAVASERQHRFPLLLAWPLLWRLYRQGAFR